MGIENGHLAGPPAISAEDRARRYGSRLWTGWFHPKFPISGIEPECVVDSNGARSESVKLPSGGTRTWHYRPLEPAQWKKDQLEGFYKELRRSINNHGVMVAVLLWRHPENGKFYVRYGASRIHVAKDLGMKEIPVVVCDYFDHREPFRALKTPAEVLGAFGPPAQVGWLEVSHERIDAHHLEPSYPS